MLTVIAVIVSALTVLGLLTVRVCPALVVVSNWPAKVRLVGLKVIVEMVALPVPVSATWMGWVAVSRLSTIFIVTALAPAEEGVNVTPTVQLTPAASDAPQVPPVPVAVKSEAFPPANVGGSVRLTEDDVLLVSITNWAAVGVPISCVPKLMLVGDTEIVAVRGRSAINAFAVAPADRSVV